MSLPKLNTPTYQLVLPSTEKKIKFRPFLVKEQKLLLMAQNSNDKSEMIQAIAQIIENCTFGKVKGSEAYIFNKSVCVICGAGFLGSHLFDRQRF